MLVGAGAAVPHAALKAGVAWPNNVQPDAREAYLSAAEFQQVFGMSYAAFLALPVWKQKQLKHMADLF
jgi:hypothetical protein